MDVQQAQRALSEIRAREEQTLRAAYPRLPWWAYVSEFAFFALIGAAGELSAIEVPVLYWGFYGVAWIVYFGATWLLGRRPGVKHRLGVHPGPQGRFVVVQIVVLLAVLISASTASYLLDLPVHAAFAGVVTGLASAALKYWFQPARYLDRARR